ncbi:hypothetical protein [Marinicauda salina]|uniref:hypothetical protein n=1 Tax=Marinicauda salina TaxID=2135793 RepID=UPI0011B1CF64|nr:hypothetical protein [Marinicauda salina]
MIIKNKYAKNIVSYIGFFLSVLSISALIKEGMTSGWSKIFDLLFYYYNQFTLIILYPVEILSELLYNYYGIEFIENWRHITIFSLFAFGAGAKGINNYLNEKIKKNQLKLVFNFVYWSVAIIYLIFFTVQSNGLSVYKILNDMIIAFFSEKMLPLWLPIFISIYAMITIAFSAFSVALFITLTVTRANKIQRFRTIDIAIKNIIFGTVGVAILFLSNAGLLLVGL